MDKRHQVRINRDRRITLPVALRRSMGLTGGERARWTVNDDGTVEVTFEPRPTR
jgi:bifunctional DNA-binding transcriptional regulator/antitoxin component of YhaV-PrlF toxin-antitoxin module